MPSVVTAPLGAAPGGDAAGLEEVSIGDDSLPQGDADLPCSGSCGGVEKVCVEQRKPMKTLTWNHVGSGKGGYEKMHSYNFVGEGHGSWNQQQVAAPHGWRVRPGCVVFLFVLVFAIFACVARVQVLPTGTTTGAPSTTLEPFDCHSETMLSVVKKGYCCEHHGLFCGAAVGKQPSGALDRPASTTLPPLQYDCNLGFEAWEDMWSAAKQIFCCQHRQRACSPKPPAAPAQAVPPPPPPVPSPARKADSDPFDCNAGFTTWITGWSERKKSWCCSHEAKACPSGEHKRYDCAAGVYNWQLGWSSGKKSWCCQHESKGCSRPAP